MATNKTPPNTTASHILFDEGLVNVKFVAQLFDCSENTIWRRVRSGMLPAPIHVSPQQTRWRVGDIRKALASLGNGQEAE